MDPGAGSTPFTFNLRALLVENVQRTKLPDIIEPVTGKPLSGGATFTAATKMAGEGPRSYESLHDSLVYKAQVFANEGEVIRTIYGTNPIPDETITVEWDGMNDAGVSVPGGDAECGMSVTAMLYRGTDPRRRCPDRPSRP